MANKRKFEIGDIADWWKPIMGTLESLSMRYYCVVVDYKQSGTGRGWYRVVRVLHPVNGAAFGESVWVATNELKSLPHYPKRTTVVRSYRANKRLLDRECECNCCTHEAIPSGVIRQDGTFDWEVV